MSVVEGYRDFEGGFRTLFEEMDVDDSDSLTSEEMYDLVVLRSWVESDGLVQMREFINLRDAMIRHNHRLSK